MKHADHVALIRGGVEGRGPRWLELGAGDGAFTLALADLLGPDGSILAVDRDRWALAELAARLASRFPELALTTLVADFETGLPAGPFDGVLAANSLHFVADQAAVLRTVHAALAPGSPLVLVEYDAERGNPYVPHPIAFDRLAVAGRGRRVHAAASPAPRSEPVPGGDLRRRRDPAGVGGEAGPGLEAGTRVLHSGPHGDDREE